MRRVTSFLFLASVFCVTFEKVHWNIAGNVSLADVLAIGFLIAFVAGTRRWRVPHTSAVLACFLAVFLLVYLIGYFDLSDSDALAQWGKGLTKWAIHFAFLGAAVVWLSRRGQRYFWRTLGWFSAGIVFNAAYGSSSCSMPAAVATSTRRCCRRSPAVRARSTSTARSTVRACSARTR